MPRFARKRMASDAGFTSRGFCSGMPISLAILFDSSWSIVALSAEHVSNVFLNVIRGRGKSSQASEDASLRLLALRSTEVTRDVLDKVGAFLIGEDSLVEVTGLFEIELGHLGEVEDCSADELLVSRNVIRLLLVRETLERRDIVRAVSLVLERHETITLEVGNRVRRSVDRKLSIVRTESVAVSVGVREETRLEDRVGRRLDTLGEVRGREGDLFDFRAARARPSNRVSPERTKEGGARRKMLTSSFERSC